MEEPNYSSQPDDHLELMLLNIKESQTFYCESKRQLRISFAMFMVMSFMGFMILSGAIFMIFYKNYN